MCSLFLGFRYSAWVVFNADGSLDIYIKKIKESQHLFVYTIIISENSPVLFGYFVLARMRACTILWKTQCSRNFGKIIKQSALSEYAETTHPKTRPKMTQPKLPTARNLCLMNVLRPFSIVKAVNDI